MAWIFVLSQTPVEVHLLHSELYEMGVSRSNKILNPLSSSIDSLCFLQRGLIIIGMSSQPKKHVLLGFSLLLVNFCCDGRARRPLEFWASFTVHNLRPTVFCSLSISQCTVFHHNTTKWTKIKDMVIVFLQTFSKYNKKMSTDY